MPRDRKNEGFNFEIFASIAVNSARFFAVACTFPCRPREGGDKGAVPPPRWMPDCAGMTNPANAMIICKYNLNLEGAKDLKVETFEKNRVTNQIKCVETPISPSFAIRLGLVDGFS